MVKKKLNFDKIDQDDLLETSISILKKVYELGKKRDDVEIMLGVSDRLCLIYEKMLELQEDGKSPMGFSSISIRNDDE